MEEFRAPTHFRCGAVLCSAAARLSKERERESRVEQLLGGTSQQRHGRKMQLTTHNYETLHSVSYIYSLSNSSNSSSCFRTFKISWYPQHALCSCAQSSSSRIMEASSMMFGGTQVMAPPSFHPYGKLLVAGGTQWHTVMAPQPSFALQ